MIDYEPNADAIVAVYQLLEDSVIKSMVRRMLNMGIVSDYTKYQAELLQAAGLLYDDIISAISKSADASVAQVRALFEDAGVATIDIDNEIIEDTGQDTVGIKQDAGMRQMMGEGYKKTLGTMRNLVSTTATESQAAFISAADKAYIGVSSGAFSYQQAIMDAVKLFADTGAIVSYPTGHRDRLDVAMRRAVLTGVGQTSANVAEMHAKESGCYLMELTAHAGARPEHARWQGQLVSLSGKDVGKNIDGLHVYSLRDIGYKKGDGFKGWNCRHNWHPYYKGISEPNYTKEDIKGLDAKSIPYKGDLYSRYEISQMQRKAERNVRALKRRVIATQEAIKDVPDDDTKNLLVQSFNASAQTLKKSENELSEFCKQTKSKNDKSRVQVAGFGKSISQKAVHAAKNASANTDKSSGGKAVEIDIKSDGTNGGNGRKYEDEKI